MTTRPKRAAVYARVSTLDQTTENQEAKREQHAGAGLAAEGTGRDDHGQRSYGHI